jgi:uncharacterized protein (TIGR01777 family)
MPSFKKTTIMQAGPATVFGYHERPGAFERLTPPWEPVTLAGRTGTIRDGDRATLLIKQGPFRLRWVAEHRDFIANEQFKDVAVSGPFRKWEHTHRVEPHGDGGCVLADSIEYALPGAALGNAMAGGFVRRKLERMFAYRHRVTADDTTMIDRYPHAAPMRVLITGASGMVGSALANLLSTAGHHPAVLRRKGQPASSTPWDSIAWDPNTGAITEGSLDGFDAVVHLAGAGVADKRWTADRKREIRDSRIEGTRRLCEALAATPNPPRVLVAASAIGYYGNSGYTLIDESAPMGEGFLAEVCRDWEAATGAAEAAGIRVVHLRIGIVLSMAGGALAKMRLPFLLGAGGRLGDGRQYMSWIALDDVLGAIHHAMRNEAVRGPVNAVAPNACTNQSFTQTLARVLRRPALFPVPRAALRVAVGELTDEGLLASARVQPAVLTETGYVFRFSNLESAFRHALGRTTRDAAAN